MTLPLYGKIFLLLAVIFFVVGFYISLAGAYASDHDHGEDYPEDQRKIIYINILIFLGSCCVLISLGILITDIIKNY